MKNITRLAAFLLVCLCLFTACAPKENKDTFEVDPGELYRETKLVCLKDQGELPEENFCVQLTDTDDKPVPDATIRLVLSGGAGESTAATDKDGKAYFSPAVEPGDYEAEFFFDGQTYFGASSVSATLTVFPFVGKSGVYLRYDQMGKVDFAALAEKGVGHVFLHQEVLTRLSREGIEEFIARAEEAHVHVHLWLICLWDNGDFVVPIVEKDYYQSYFDSEAEKVKQAAALNGLYGLHFDYIRFDGTKTRADAFNAKNGAHGELSITEFVSQMAAAADSVNNRLILSGAIMPEYADLVPVYGQDLKGLSRYLDFFVPMLYAGNYDKDDAWITECVRFLKQNEPELEFRPALLSYVSDSNSSVRSADAIRKSAEAAFSGGAEGVNLFLYGTSGGGSTLSGFDLIPPTDGE